MRIQHTLRAGRSVYKRLLAVWLSLLLLLTSVPSSFLKVFAEENDAFTIELSWNSSAGANDADSSAAREWFVYQSEMDETRTVRLKLNYKSNGVTQRSFAPGELTITIPGLYGAFRSSTYSVGKYEEITSAGADPMDAATKQYSWSYSYSRPNNTYTFTNNKTVEMNTSFEGSFELIWLVPSRDTIKEYETDFQAVLRAENISVSSNKVYYRQYREPDQYRVKIAASKLYQDEMPSTEKRWIRYTVSGQDIYCARDVDGAERFELYFLSGTDVRHPDLQQDTTKTKVVDGVSYDCWYVYKNIDKDTRNPYLEDIFVGYPKDTPDEEVLLAYVEIHGRYYEDEAEGLLAEHWVDIQLKDFDYKDIPGDLYDAYKLSYGMHNTTIDEVFNRRANPDFRGAIDALHLTNGGGEYYSDLKLAFKYDNMNNPDREYIYDLEFVDDFLQIEKLNGEIRMLEENEYHFTKIVIPSVNDILNSNGLPIQADKYAVEIYYKKRGTTPTGKIDDQINIPLDIGDVFINESEQEFELPADYDEQAVAVRIIIRNMEESLSVAPWEGHEKSYPALARCYYEFDVDDIDAIRTEKGRLINNMFFNIYRKTRGEDPEVTWMNDNFTEANYEYADMIMDRDLLYYGHYLDREKDETPILEIPSRFKMKSVSIQQRPDNNPDAFFFDGTITSEFSLGEGAALNGFTMYTIIPQGMRLEEQYNDPELLLSQLSFWKDGKAYSDLARYVRIEIVDDPEQYDGRQMVRIHFDFTGAPLSEVSTISVSGLPMYQSKHALNFGVYNMTFRAGMLLDPEGQSYNTRGQKWYADSTDKYTEEHFLWVDLDGDDDLDELASFAACDSLYIYPESTEVQLTKYVQTPLTNDKVQPDANADAGNAPEAYIGGEYSYFLRASITDVRIDNILFVDTIEPDILSEWHGTIQEVVTDGVTEKLVAPEGQVLDAPVIYCSAAQVIPDDKLEDNNFTIDRSILDAYEWKKWEELTEAEIAGVRSIAVDFGNGIAQPQSQENAKSELWLEIRMKAPNDTSKVETLAKNVGHIGYDKWNASTGNPEGHETLVSNIVPVTYVQMGTLSLIKQDEIDGALLGGAEFQLYRVTGYEPDGTTPIGELVSDRVYVTNIYGRITVSRLPYDAYYFVETKAPSGYVLPEAPEDRRSEIVVLEDAQTVVVTMENERRPGEVWLIKVSDRLPDRKLAGAKFDLYKADEGSAPRRVRTDLVTDSNGILKIRDLTEWGSYYLLETEAPDGYEILQERTDFVIDRSHGAAEGEPLEITVVNRQKPGMVMLVKYELAAGNEYDTPGESITEADINRSKPIEGAVYELYRIEKNNSETLITSAVTDNEGRIYVDGLTFGTYFFIETTSVIGYEKNLNRVCFTVDEENTRAYVPVITADGRTAGRVHLKKLDDRGTDDLPGKPVENAVYSLFDFATQKRLAVVPTGIPGHYVYTEKFVSGKVFEMTTNNEGVIEITGLYWKHYYMQEVREPTGYQISEEQFDIDFTNGRNVEKQLIFDAEDECVLGSVRLIKIGNDDETNRLAGAVFRLYKNDGSLYKDNIRTDSNGVAFVDKLEWGGYYFEEKEAPSGYGLNEQKISFSVSNLTAGRTQEIMVNDPIKQCQLTVTKKLLKEDIAFEHGDPTFMFQVQGNGHTYKKAVTITQSNLKNFENEDYVTASVTFAVPAGTYTVSELAVNRYKLIGITSNKTTGVVIDMAAGTATVTLGSETFDEIEFVFENEKTRQRGTSDTDMVTNILHRARKLTAVSAVYNGSKVIPLETTLEDILENLSVWAIYDDGAEVELTFDDSDKDEFTEGKYKLSNDVDFVFTSSNGNYTTFTVTYKDEVTRTDTFSLLVYDDGIFIWHVIKDSKPFVDEGRRYEGEIVITGYKGTSTSVTFPKLLEIPDPKTGGYFYYKVKQVGEGEQLKNAQGEVCAQLVSISFADGIEVIGDKLFDQTATYVSGRYEGNVWIPGYYIYDFPSLTTLLHLSDSITYIGTRAFYYCDQLTGDIHLSENLKTIGTRAFYNCTGLTGSLDFYEGLESIGEYAFNNCNKLTGDLVIPETVTSIGEYAFASCRSISSLTLSPMLKTIESNTFTNMPGLTSITIPYGVEKISEHAFSSSGTGDADLIIPASVTEIGERAFYSFGLTGQLTIEEGVKPMTISDNAFNSNKFSGSLTIPDNVTTIGNNAFQFHNDARVTEILIGNGVKTIGNNAFAVSWNSNQVVKRLVIGNSVESIGEYAFYYCGYKTPDAEKMQEDFVIPNSVKTIGKQAFESFGVAAGNFIISNQVTIIADYTFDSMPVKAIFVPESVRSVGNYAFAYIYDPAKIYLPENCSVAANAISPRNDRTGKERMEVIYYDNYNELPFNPWEN